MMRYLLAVLMCCGSLSVLATNSKNITINNHSPKPIYYGVFVHYHLSSIPGLWEPRSIAPWRTDTLHLELSDSEGLIDVVVIENTGPIDEISALSTLKPICEFSVVEKSDFTMPLDQVDLNNYADSTFSCRVDLNKRTLTIH